jgi:teichuronic acid biosynthesis glycosyltransferase TuaG
VTADSQSPLFSIVMPMFNASKCVAASIASVLAQTETRWELLVVDDCSTDDSLVVLSSLIQKDSRIKVIQQPVNAGVAAARNAGLKVACGKYICFLDADDFWLPQKLEMQLKALASGHDVVFSSYYRLLPNERFAKMTSSSIVKFEDFDFGNPIGNLTGCYNRECLGLELQKKCGHEDYVMWREIVRRAGYAFPIAMPLAIYSVSGTSLSGAKKKAALWQWTLLREQFHFSFFYAAIAFAFYAKSRIWNRALEKMTARPSSALMRVVRR